MPIAVVSEVNPVATLIVVVARLDAYSTVTVAHLFFPVIITLPGSIKWVIRIPTPLNNTVNTRLMKALGCAERIFIFEADNDCRGGLSADHGKSKKKDGIKQLHDAGVGDRNLF